MFEFGETTGSFDDSRKPVKFFSLLLLDGVTLFEILVVSVLGIPVPVYQSFHRDDGTCTTEIVLVHDGDAGLFYETSNGGTARFVAFTVPIAGTRGTNVGSFHGEGVIGGKLFVGVSVWPRGPGDTCPVFHCVLRIHAR